MAEGSIEEDSGDMLGPVAVPNLHISAPYNASKDEEDSESNNSSSIGSPEPASNVDSGGCGSDSAKNFHARLEDAANNDAKLPNTHLNNAMAGLVSLQNLASLQQNLPQVASLAVGLQNIAGLTGTSVNTPLNLSINSTATPLRISPSSNGGATAADNSPNHQQQSSAVAAAAAAAASTNPTILPSTCSAQQPAPMPQLILASGQLVQGIQGAQLLIPTSQGLATQTILTIPVNHVNSSDQIVNLALNNGQIVTTSLANLQAMAQTNLLNNTANGVVPTTNGLLNPSPPSLNQLVANSSNQQSMAHIPQLLNNCHNPAPLINPLGQSLLSSPAPPPPSTLLSTHTTESVPTLRTATTTNYPSSVESKFNHHQLTRNSSPPLNRISTANGEITITTTTSSNSAQNYKRSPASLSPTCNNDNSTADLLVDSPNQPTINQTNSNVVDGINLDEIKDFAKAFKLRRLSLGLTQTQVGQALSVTEGPAYSQSAICSALASQMFAAAHLSSQQQAMFEKLDITPKSAQKIKPVLERWMKEAEERYKSGQNHLTDFIGIEPSKKRKRRTSFTPQALELLNAHFERNTHPSGTEITGLAHQLGYEREVIRIWFCNKRQALKNTVRMMSKGMV